MAVFDTISGHPNLQGYWRFDGDFVDSGPNGYNLSTTGTINDVTGAFGGAKDFVPNAKAYNSAANCNITGSQTWIAWVKPDLANNGAIIGLRASGGGNERILDVDSGGVHYLLDNLSPREFTHSYAWDISNYQMVVMVYDSGANKVKTYINGSLINTESVTGSLAVISSNFTIGANGDNNARYFNGKIDEVAILNTALSSGEIQQIYLGASAGFMFQEDL